MKLTNSDSGHNSSQSSPSHSEKDSFHPVSSLESSKPRRPKSQFVKPSQAVSSDFSSHRLSYQQPPEYHRQNSQQDTTVYRADTVTYADLDPKAFMIPQNRVLPNQTKGSNFSDSSRSTYAEISVSKSHLV